MLSAWKDGLKEKKKGGGTETMLFGSITYGSPDTFFFKKKDLLVCVFYINSY